MEGSEQQEIVLKNFEGQNQSTDEEVEALLARKLRI